jgi:hypothetical protein
VQQIGPHAGVPRPGHQPAQGVRAARVAQPDALGREVQDGLRRVGVLLVGGRQLQVVG